MASVPAFVVYKNLMEPVDEASFVNLLIQHPFRILLINQTSGFTSVRELLQISGCIYIFVMERGVMLERREAWGTRNATLLQKIETMGWSEKFEFFLGKKM